MASQDAAVKNGAGLRFPVCEKKPPPYEIGYHHEKFLYNHKGCFLEYPKYLTLEDCLKFQASPLDCCVCAMPKTGTTWLNAIMIGVLANGDRSAFYDAPLEVKSPFFCRCEPEMPIGTRPIDILSKKPPGRTFFTHFAYQALPESIVTSGAKKCYIYRNPKDSIISMYHFLQAQTRIGFHGDLDEVIDSFINDHVEFGPFFDHIASYWKMRHVDPNIFFTSFEELKKNPEDVIRRLGVFLGKNLTPEQIHVIAEETKFEKFQANKLLNKSKGHEMGFLDFNKSQFIRDGRVGQWKEIFSPEQNKRVDEWTARNLARPELQGIHFEYE